MVGLFIALIVIAVILFILGIAVKVAMWLIYIAIILALIGVIGWILRGISGRRR